MDSRINNILNTLNEYKQSKRELKRTIDQKVKWIINNESELEDIDFNLDVRGFDKVEIVKAILIGAIVKIFTNFFKKQGKVSIKDVMEGELWSITDITKDKYLDKYNYAYLVSVLNSFIKSKIRGDTPSEDKKKEIIFETVIEMIESYEEEFNVIETMQRIFRQKV